MGDLVPFPTRKPTDPHLADSEVWRHIPCARCGEVFALILGTEDAADVAKLAKTARTCRWHK